MTTVALADDHELIRNALADLINSCNGYKVIYQAMNGKELIQKFELFETADITFVDINMPIMDGYLTAQHLSQNFPETTLMALSIEDHDECIIKMLRNGCKGYLLKDTTTEEFKLALNEIKTKGYYHSDLVTNSLLNSLRNPNFSSNKPLIQYQAREEEFLHLACSEMTYKEIADRMCVSPRTIDGYRENLFLKLEVKSRVGLVLFAIKHGIVEL
ncbi:response regulator [Jiulongibacter sp. NS-SX5]|uniref:response regulator n=1 Tax=Jiulongibacter sp. NS-SX5 TaxID=3463854 RepID=UPI00405A13C6